MASYSATVLMNGDTNYLHSYKEGDRLGYDARTILHVPAPDMDAALNRVYAIGNRQGRDSLGREWSSDIRSVSIGDVVWLTTVTENGLVSGAWAVEPVGFRLIGDMPSARYGEVELVRIGVARPAGVRA